MSTQKRRNFVKLTGGVIGLGSVLASSGPVVAASTQEEQPPLRGPYADEDWVGYRGGPGHTGAIEEPPDVDAEGQDCTLFYDGDFKQRPVIVDDTMYVVDYDGIKALDVRDGSVLWTREFDNVSTGIAAAYGKLFTTSIDDTDPHNNFTILRAHDIQDGRLAWEREFDHDTATFPTVAYEMIYIDVGGVTYALSVADGSTEWEADVGFISWKAVHDGMVYTTDSAGSEHDGSQLVALDAFTGEERWRIAERHNVQVTATDGRVSAYRGFEETTVYDASSGDPILSAETYGNPAHDHESFATTDRTTLRTYFFDDRETMQWGYFESDSISDPTIAGDTVYVYVGDGGSDYDYSIVALDKYTGAVEWSREVEQVDSGSPEIVATRDAVYVLGDEEIHALHDTAVERDYCGASDGDDSTDEDDATDGDDSSGGDDTTDGDDSTTPDDTPTPEESGEDCGCPDDNDSPSDGDDPPTDTATATDEDAPSGESTESPDEDHQAVEDGTATDETAGDGPGLGIVSAVTSLGGIGYVLRRRVRGGETEQER